MRRPLAALAVAFALWLGLAAAALAQNFLDPTLAFRPTLQALDARTLEIRYDIADGYYLYRDKFRFALAGQPLPAEIPPGSEKDDENFGRVEVFHRQVAIRLPLGAAARPGQTLTLTATAQGCADAGLCYPPQTQELSLTLPALPAPAPAAPAANSAPLPLPTPPAATATDPLLPSPAATPAPPAADAASGIASRLAGAGFWANLAFFFLAGLGLALTPCVLPMVPILSGIIAGQGHKLSRGRGFALALAYVLGMALTYAAAGVVAGLSGTLVSGLLQNAWVLGGFALLFVILAGAMFGFYELQLPSRLQSRLAEDAGHFQGGRGPAVFAMGALSALIVGPCVAAPLAGALLYIGKTGDAWLGGAALFALALGMGAPLLALGASAGTLLPRVGAWMNAVKQAFGYLLLGTALWLLAPVLPPPLLLAGWGVLLIVPAIALHALDPLPPPASAGRRFWKGIGVVLLLTGSALLVGALAGGRDPLQPLAGLRGTAAAETPLPFVRIASLAELDTRLQGAGRPVLLDFSADWCTDCKTMERTTFADPRVRQRLGDFLLLKADITANSAADQALQKRFGLYGPPAIVLFTADGREAGKLVGYQSAEQLLAALP